MSDLVTSEEHQPPAVAPPLLAAQHGQFGVIVFLASDVMLFAPFFAAYFLLRAEQLAVAARSTSSSMCRGRLFGTAVLVISSFTLMMSDRAGERPGGERAMRRWLLVTIALGVGVPRQPADRVPTRSTSRPTADPYGSVYVLLTGLHGVPRHGRHVRDGTAVRARRSAAATTIAVATWAGGVSLFWHLVDVVWVIVFTTIWIIR